ncbi:glycosyl transferase [Fragilaria crotonensis]|nr:glycosyl transferase [Fragilaria crotonensis]
MRLSGSTKGYLHLLYMYVIAVFLSFISIARLFRATAKSDTSNLQQIDIPEIIVTTQDERREVTTLIGRNNKAILDECQSSLVRPVSRIQQEIAHQKPERPLLHSMIKVDGAYRMIFATEHMRHLYAAWTTNEGTSWSCDGQPALLHANQSQNDSGQGGTLVITCPLTVKLVTGTTVGRGAVEYNTSIWRNCSDHDELQGIPEASVERMVCTMFLGDHFELAQWIEYHRIIGFQHFLIYLHGHGDVENSTSLPIGADITYIPWNFVNFGYHRDGMMRQAVQQMDCIQRAQARNVTWVALHDMDEYFQIMDNSTLEDILASHEADEHMGGLQIPSWFFGENLSENTTALASNETLKLVIDSVWRGKTGYRGGKRGVGREKMIIRPRRVVYFACHQILIGGPMIGEPRIRLNHYKLRHTGVLYAGNNIVKDDSLQTHFGPLLRVQLKLD